jgi:hypothetical protein
MVLKEMDSVCVVPAAQHYIITSCVLDNKNTVTSMPEMKQLSTSDE